MKPPLSVSELLEMRRKGLVHPAAFPDLRTQAPQRFADAEDVEFEIITDPPQEETESIEGNS